MADNAAVLADLADESADLDALVTRLPEQDWRRDTPAAGWSVAHQIGHLAWTDDLALLAATNADAFAAALQAALREFTATSTAPPNSGRSRSRPSCSTPGASGARHWSLHWPPLPPGRSCRGSARR